MKQLPILCSLLLSCSVLAEIKREISGNVEAQVRQANNNSEAKEDLFQNWNNENFYLIYGNLSGKVEIDKSRIEANYFTRYSKSELYDPKQPSPFGNEPYFATRIYTFPNKLVARDMFKLQHIQQGEDYKYESILNKLYYEYEFEENRFMFGRIYVNYGQGEIFNPVNPFNQPTGLTAISQVAQGNDGLSFTYFQSDNHTIQFLLLGDKSVDDYEGDIEETLWVHGELQAAEDLQLDYVFGKDQLRQKIGGQASYNFAEAMVFTQLLYQSEYTNSEPSNDLFDLLLGYDQQLTNIWHIRIETGYQKENEFITPQSFERFLPVEYFASLANVVEVHPLVKVSATLVSDVKTGFFYFIGKGTYDMGHDMEAEYFTFTPVAKGDEPNNVRQKLVTTDVGLALRAFF